MAGSGEAGPSRAPAPAHLSPQHYAPKLGSRGLARVLPADRVRFEFRSRALFSRGMRSGAPVFLRLGRTAVSHLPARSPRRFMSSPSLSLSLPPFFTSVVFVFCCFCLENLTRLAPAAACTYDTSSSPFPRSLSSIFVCQTLHSPAAGPRSTAALIVGKMGAIELPQVRGREHGTYRATTKAVQTVDAHTHTSEKPKVRLSSRAWPACNCCGA